VVSPTVVHDWRVVAPWYRWERRDGKEPERAQKALQPALHKYVSTAYVDDFLADPQHSVVFDAATDTYQRVVAIPAAELNAGDGRFRSLAKRRLVPTEMTKLFLPAHQRHYIVAVGLHCHEPGFPRVDPQRVSEVGFVIRRHRVEVPTPERPVGATLLYELTAARATAQSKQDFVVARDRSRILHPFRSPERMRVVSAGAAIAAARQEVELAKRRLRVWAEATGVVHRSEAWVATGEGSFGAWVPIADEPEELIERWYPMRLLTARPDDPYHAAHDGTIYYATIPTASDEISPDGTARFNDLDTYEIRVFVRPEAGECPGPLAWSLPTDRFRIASFFDPTGCAQRPTEIRLPDFAQLEASDALPSVKVSAPAGSSLEFSKFGETPTKGKVGGAEICFFSIPLITIIAMFVLNIFLPIVMFIFQLWWMLKLKFCIPPSIQFEADLAAELDVEPGEISATAELDVDVLPGVDQAALGDLLAGIFNPPVDPELDPVPAEWQLGDKVTGLFTNDPLVELLVRNGYGSAASGGAPTFTVPFTYTEPVRRDEVVHP
jgi:hypothetical protein